jgi:hypothetical protein
VTLSAATRGALERLAASMSALTLILIVVADAIPLLVLLVLALVQGLTTGEYPEGSGMGASGDFPPFDPQLWMAWLPVAAYGVWAIITVPLPVPRRRFPMLLTGLLLFAATIARIAGFVGHERIADGGTRYILVVIMVCAGLILLRAILGTLRLVPRSWLVARPGS